MIYVLPNVMSLHASTESDSEYGLHNKLVKLVKLAYIRQINMIKNLYII